jgi:hypothetical protein
MISELLVPHDPYIVKTFICPFTPREMITGFGFSIVAQKDSTLKIFRHFGSSQAEPSLGHVNETDNSVEWSVPGLFPFGV